MDSVEFLLFRLNEVTDDFLVRMQYEAARRDLSTIHYHSTQDSSAKCTREDCAGIDPVNVFIHTLQQKLSRVKNEYPDYNVGSSRIYGE